jgi:hypothetical protein
VIVPCEILYTNSYKNNSIKITVPGALLRSVAVKNSHRSSNTKSEHQEVFSDEGTRSAYLFIEEFNR